MMLLNILLLLAASCCCVNAYCNETSIKKIQNFWGKTPLKISPTQLVGTSTNIYYTQCADDIKTKKCSQTTLARDDLTAVDYDEMLDGSTKISDTYYYIPEAPGMITQAGPNMIDEYLYFVYVNGRNGVYAYYQCMPFVEFVPPFSGVIAVNYDKNNRDTARAIQTSLDVLNKLGLNDVHKCPLNCKTFNRNIN